jgi:DNA/RNA-binding domain of Phe-tRNA-synthetase-like protein
VVSGLDLAGDSSHHPIVSVTLDSVDIDLAIASIGVGLVIARGCRVGPAPEALDGALSASIQAAKSRSVEETTGLVRDMLRHGKYKPTGRGKPASEYLHRSALEDRFPRINNLVDINNLISLDSLLPISLVDLARAQASRFAIRHGRPGESYVFNSAGQIIDVQDLIVVARLPADEACANPVKDSLATKLDERSADVMAVLYAPLALRAVLEDSTKRFERALIEWGGAKSAASAIMSAG